MTTEVTPPQTTQTPSGRFECAIIDTINEIISAQVLKTFREKGKATFDDWKDYAVEFLDFQNFCKSLPNTIVIPILGREATGKTVGASFLNPQTTAFFNVDGKPLTFLNARKMYNKESKNYLEAKDYKTLETALKNVHSNSCAVKGDKPFVIFLLAHIEDYKDLNGKTAFRMRIPGKMAHKYNIDGAFIHTYYTFIDTSKDLNDPERYQLITGNQGGDITARSPMGTWDSILIQNNYQLILDRVQSLW
jgi:hypothetical protein